ncbi:MAG: complex I subunit 5 family protein, partial [Desulfovibrionales bacterium]|nr:complex I subunit 5 family protein [Desulfovibrionales bacterium]
MPNILLQIIFVPALISIFIFLARYQIGKKAGWLAGYGLLYTTYLLFSAGLRIYGGMPNIHEEYLLIAPNIRLALFADGLSVAVAFIANVLCTVLCFYSIRYVDHRVEIIYGHLTEREDASYYTRFFYLFPFFPMGFMGISFAANLIAMYFFLEVLTVTLYFLMAYFGYVERVKIAMMCLLWGIFSAVFFLAGSLLIYSQLGSFEISKIPALAGNPLTFWIILIFLIGLFAKLAIFPFHVWMPWIHAEHPTCIAGLLAVYANIAAYIIVRILILPLFNDFQVFGIPIMVMALITMIYGSLLTMAQTDIKRIAACSTISQIAYSMLGLGALTMVSIEGGMFFFLSHIMGKTIFFSTAGLVVYTTGIRDIRNMGGLARKMPITALLWVSGAMMLSGFPPFSSFTAEWIMFTGIFERGASNSTA